MNKKLIKRSLASMSIFSVIFFIITFFSLFGGCYLTTTFTIVTKTKVDEKTKNIVVDKKQEYKINLGLSLFDNFKLTLDKKDISLVNNLKDGYWNNANSNMNWTYNSDVLKIAKNNELTKKDLHLDTQLEAIKKEFNDTKILIISSSIILGASIISFIVTTAVYNIIKKETK